VTNYIDISHKMNYNRNLQFARLNYNKRIRTSLMQCTCSWSYMVRRSHTLVVYRKDHGFESHRWDSFFLVFWISCAISS